MSASTSTRLRALACASAISMAAALAASAANAQCVGPDANHVVNCPAGTYSGINYASSDPGITINVAAGATVTSEGVGANGGGNITINGDPSDTFTSTDPNQAALYGRTTDGNVSLTAGDVSAPTTTAIVARTDSGDVSINVRNVNGGGGQGVVVEGLNSGAPENVSITTADVSGLDNGIEVAGTTGATTINAGNVSGGNGIGIFVNRAGGAPTDVDITAKSVSGSLNGVFINGAGGDVSVDVVGSASSAEGAGIAVEPAGGTGPTNVSITAGSVSGGNVGVAAAGATGDVNIAVAGSASSATGTAIAVSGSGDEAPMDVSVTAGSASGGEAGVDIAGATGNVSVAVAGNVSAAGGPGIDVLSNGADAPTNVTVTTGSVSASGDGIDIIGATGTADVTVNGNVSSPHATGIALATAGSAEVTVNPRASVSGVVGIDATVGADGVQGGLSIVDDGTITGTGGTAIRFLPGPSILSGDGLIVGDVTMQPGNFLAPGDLVTLSIKGHLVFSAGSSYVAEVAAGGPGRSGAPGDLVAVNGAVTINSGANFVALPLGNASSYANNTQYVVITATGGVSGTFSTVVSEAPLLSATLIYPHDEVVLKLTRNDKSFASQAVTP
ncbi:MAG TPA: hypothetical protein VKT30_14905, partial [Caulobacteraceae bacterium]|nr:hypothetical protein [Caulobacteraceae bacterium]